MRYSAKNILNYTGATEDMFTSDYIPLDQCSGFSVQLVFNNVLGGFDSRIEVSNNYQEDLNGNVISPGDWDVLDGTEIITYDQFTSGSYVWNATESNYLWARVRVQTYNVDPATFGKIFAVTKGN